MKKFGAVVRTAVILSLFTVVSAPAHAQIGDIFNSAAHDAGAAAKDANLAAREARAASEAKAAGHNSHTGTSPHGSNVHVPKTETRWIDGYGVAAHDARPVAKDVRIETEVRPATQNPQTESGSHASNVHVPKGETRWIDGYGSQASENPALKTRAQEIHGTLGKVTQTKVTTAVGEAVNADGSVTRLVGSSEGTLRPAQKAALQPGEIAVRGEAGTHAEVNVLNSAKQNGQTLTSVAPSRLACSACTETMHQNNVKVENPR